jgi:dephospho-CoA kinase
MLKIGLTGGIGSGKTKVAEVFENFGIPVYYADSMAKELMTSSEHLINSIKSHFGNEAYHEDGSLNRTRISEIIFKDSSQLEIMNKLVHPEVWKDAEDWHARQSGIPYTIQEAAVLFESGGYKRMDYVIQVTAPKEIRILRVMKRDGINRNQVLDRIAKQASEAEVKTISHFQIKNSSAEDLLQQVLKTHQKLVEYNFKEVSKKLILRT